METILEEMQNEIESSMVDVVFDITGKAIPEDNCSSLLRTVIRYLPWLEQEEQAGIHPIQAAPSDYGVLLLTRRTKLVLRVPRTRVAAAAELTGRQLDIDGNPVQVGSARPRSLPAFGTLYSHFVDLGRDDEVQFAREVVHRLNTLEIRGKFVCGKKQTLRAEGETASGFSLMLYDLMPTQSILLQERGLGGNRKLGCGIFIPHKSIAAVMA